MVAARRAEQIVENLAAATVEREEPQLEALEEAGRPQPGFPRSFLESDGVRGLIYGTTFASISA